MKISSHGLSDFILATVVTAIIAATFWQTHPAGYPYWIAGVVLVYVFAARLALSVHELHFEGNRFVGKPLVGKPVDFGFSDIREFNRESLSRPPRARIVLKRGATVLIKPRYWIKAVSKTAFEAEVRAKADAAAPAAPV